MTQATSRYLNRELSWLEFNQRVLDEARDTTVPMLERLRFLAITASNLDEFFMVRVGGLQILAQRGSVKPDPTGLTPDQQLQAIGQRTRQMIADQYACLSGEIEPGLATSGIRRLTPDQFSEAQLAAVERVFEQELSAVFTPLAVGEGEEFPLLPNRTLSLCVRLGPAADQKAGSRFAVIPFLGTFRRFLTLPSEGGYAYVLLEHAVTAVVERFFPGEPVIECVPFRITRNADMSIREDSAADLLDEMEEALDARRHSPCVRLEIADDASTDVLAFIQQALRVTSTETYSTAGPLDLSAFSQLAELPGYDSLRYEPWPPQPSPAIDPTQTMFEVLSRRDVLLHHPYDSFEPVIRLLETAASDPDVLAIKQTLYRTSRNSAIVAALERAAENGKNVTAVVELKARFDEARNIEWAKNLEHAGVQVIYGVKRLKTHAKLCIIVRREPQGIQRYVHFGTGNYNETTARLYSDLSIMTCNDELGADATAFFNAITGYSQPLEFHRIDAAPIGLREKLLEMIEAETQRKSQGQRAHIVAKLNSLVDTQIIDALYRASQEGVTVKLNVRGICCLRPGVPGLSENISVISIVDRFLEHARVFYFYHGGDERLFISSADWMPRNLDGRVELLVPVDETACRQRLISILDTYFLDNVKSRRLLPDGSYQPIRRMGRQRIVRAQEAMYRETLEAAKEARQSRPTVFEPHRATGRP